MSRGYITIAQNTADNDYLKMSYGLALSLKATQEENNICLCVDDETKSLLEPKHYEVFDDIVTIPWFDNAKYEPSWKIQNKWKYGYMSPYDETIKLDADMLFTVDVNYYWEIMKARNFGVAICNTIHTFRDEVGDDTYYRKAFKENKFYNAYSALTYFNKSDEALTFYNQVEDIYKHWEKYAEEFMRINSNDVAYTDEVYGMAVRLLGWQDKVKPPKSFSFVHLKSKCQGLLNYAVDDSPWTTFLDGQYNNEGLWINNYYQTKPVHYVEKSWCTDELITKLEKQAGV